MGVLLRSAVVGDMRIRRLLVFATWTCAMCTIHLPISTNKRHGGRVLITQAGAGKCAEEVGSGKYAPGAQQEPAKVTPKGAFFYDLGRVFI